VLTLLSTSALIPVARAAHSRASVTLTMLWRTDPNEVPALHRVFAAFSAQNPGLTVNPIIVTWANYEPKLSALIAANTVGIQQFAVPAWVSMFGVSENYAALCLIVFIVGSAGGVLVGGFFADRVHRHDRVATLGLLVAGAAPPPSRRERQPQAHRTMPRPP